MDVDNLIGTAVHSQAPEDPRYAPDTYVILRAWLPTSKANNREGNNGILVASRRDGTQFLVKITHPRAKEPGKLVQELLALQTVGKHPNIENLVQAFEIQYPYNGRAAYAGFLILSRMDTDLRNFSAQSNHALPLDVIQKCMRDVLLGLSQVHSQGVIHGNITPSSIWTREYYDDNEGEQQMFCLANFEKAHFARDSKINSGISTDLMWSAPELLGPPNTQKLFSSAMDIWSLGCVFAAMVKHVPVYFFSGDTERSSQLDMYLQLLGTPDPVALSNSGLPQPVQYEIATHHSKHRRTFMNALAFSVNPHAGNLLALMLVLDPRQRITAAAALEHPFFTQL